MSSKSAKGPNSEAIKNRFMKKSRPKAKILRRSLNSCSQVSNCAVRKILLRAYGQNDKILKKLKKGFSIIAI